MTECNDFSIMCHIFHGKHFLGFSNFHFNLDLIATCRGHTSFWTFDFYDLLIIDQSAFRYIHVSTSRPMKNVQTNGSQKIQNNFKNIFKMMSKFTSAFRPLAKCMIKNNNNITTSSLRMFSNAQTFLDRSEVTDRVFEVLRNFDKVDAAAITESAKFIKELGLDSLDAVEVVMAVEEEFALEIPDEEADKMDTPGKVIDYVVAHPMAK